MVRLKSTPISPTMNMTITWLLISTDATRQEFSGLVNQPKLLRMLVTGTRRIPKMKYIR